MKTNPHQKLFVALLILAQTGACFGQADPASEPSVLAVAKVLPAVVNINTERVVKRTVRDPVEDFYAQFEDLYVKLNGVNHLLLRFRT